ncbi:MAG TPA: PASTA domain-containing protein [Longimicrobium sp.]
MPRRVSLSLVPILVALALCAGAPLRAQVAGAVPTMPDVVGMPQDQAMGRLRALQMNVQVRPVSSAQPRGVVVSQEPGAGSPVRVGSGAVLEVSTGQPANQGQTQGQTTDGASGGVSGPRIGVRVRIPSQVTVPDLTGMSPTMARIRLVTGNLIPGGIDSTAAPDARPGRIVAQDPAPGTVVRPGTRVRMTIANRARTPVTPPAPPPAPKPELVAVPNLGGQSVADARTALGGARLLLGGVDSTTSSAPIGTVVRQTPAAGDSVQPGTMVSIVIARQQLVTVPSLAGQTLPTARRTLVDAGLRPGAVTEQERPGEPAIVGQSVPAGTRVAPGTVVNLTVSRAPVVVLPPPPPPPPPAAVDTPARPQPRDTTPATQPAPTDTTPAAQPVDSAAIAQPAEPQQPVVPATQPQAQQPARPQPAAQTGGFPRAVLWGLIALLLMAAAAVTYLRMRRRVVVSAPKPQPMVAAAPAPPVGVRMRVSSGESRTTSETGSVAGSGRVKLGVRIADPRPVEADGKAPLGPGRVAVRAVESQAPPVPTEQPETVGTANRIRVQVRRDEPAFRADGGPVILKRR